MALSYAVLNELKRELEHLRRVRGTIDGRIQGLELIVSGAQPAERDDLASLGVDLSRDGRLDSTTSTASGAVLHQVSLRTKVLEAITERPGATSTDVSQAIAGDGFLVSGVTTLRNRVSHEISRLKRLGKIRKERNGLYVVGAAVRGGDKRTHAGKRDAGGAREARLKVG
jgi:hypothetical protein